MSYSGDPTSSPLDEIRFRLGDTDETSELLTDAEIEACILLASDDENANDAAVMAVKAILAKLARSSADRQVGNLRLSKSQVVSHYRALLADLEAGANRGVSIPFAGGILVADKDIIYDDTSRVPAAFTRSQYSFNEGRDRYGYR